MLRKILRDFCLDSVELGYFCVLNAKSPIKIWETPLKRRKSPIKTYETPLRLRKEGTRHEH